MLKNGILSAIENCTNNYKHRKAVIFQDEIEIHITYNDLCIISDQICEKLSNDTLSTEQNGVFCLLEPSILIPPLILGILKANMYFAFVNVNDSLRNMKNISKYLSIRFAVCTKELLVNLNLNSEWRISQKLMTQFGEIIFLHKIDNCQKVETREKDLKLIYVTQTSGTTKNTPKIIQVPEQCILPNLVHFQSLFKITENDIIPLIAPLTFDPSIVEIFIALSAGATLLIITERLKKAPNLLLQALTHAKITALQCCPSLLLRFGKRNLKNYLFSKSTSLRFIILGGEKCPNVKFLKDIRENGNETKFYNVYGTTEVSCWASTYEITFQEEDEIPIGVPILETDFEIRNNLDNSIDCGELFIGSNTRICLINDEKPLTLVKNVKIWRSTGDWVERINGHIYCRHRVDDVVKYNGKKINISSVNSTLDEIKNLESYYVMYHAEKQILIIFAMKTELENDITRDSLIKIVRDNLDVKVPIEVYFMKSQIPVTYHGKIDTKLLIKIFDNKRKLKNSSMLNAEIVTELFSRLWKDYTKTKIEDEIVERSNFLQYGCDSVTAVQLTMDVEHHLNQSYPLLLDKLLHSDFKSVLEYLKGTDFEATDTPTSMLTNYKTELSFHRKINVSNCYQALSRAKIKLKCVCDQNCVKSDLINEDTQNIDEVSIKLNLKWKFDLSKCIDATPLVVNYQSGDSAIFIGSHSGIFAAIDLLSGSPYWSLKVSDRIESSACLSNDGQYVLFGCYDYHLYCVCVVNGELKWKFKTEAEIKSSPVTDPTKNVVYCCSHDKNLYLLDIETGVMLKSLSMGRGSLFASPAVYLDPYLVYVASLDGYLSSVDPITMKVKNSTNIGKPLFSSPLCLKSGVCIGCVDNYVYFFNHDGLRIWSYDCGKPIFCSPSLTTKGEILIGCQNNSLHCLNPQNGCQKWRVDVESQVYGTPVSFICKNRPLIAFASTKGTIYVVDDEGRLILNEKLQGELFSSIIYLNGYLVVGCRDNNVYCFEIT